MIVVANKLSELALQRNNTDFDVFGRSAFNRYYYASYLITREMLGQLEPAWARTPHKGIPDLLNQTIAKKIRNAAQQQSGKLISMHDAKQIRIDANVSVGDLATLLTSAYTVRCIADYDPDQRIHIANSSFTLFSHTNHEASQWPKRATIHSKTILRIWRNLAIT
jgi:hypothetical protein